MLLGGLILDVCYIVYYDTSNTITFLIKLISEVQYFDISYYTDFRRPIPWHSSGTN